VLLWCSGLTEVFKKGSIDILIALVISSFTLTSVVLQLHEKSGKTNRKENKIIILFNFFMLGGLLMSTGFLLPFVSLVNNSFLFSFICTLTAAGISFFVTGCIVLMLEIKDRVKD
jgi:membrane protein CcdC involved in cytochrome C biogenesis